MQKQNHQPTLQPSLSAETGSPAYPPTFTLGGNTHVNSSRKLLDAETESPAYPAAFTLGGKQTCQLCAKIVKC